MRPTTSTPPAAANGITMVIGRVGQSWLAAGAGSASRPMTASVCGSLGIVTTHGMAVSPQLSTFARDRREIKAALARRSLCHR
jgi:hypothetical protein